MMNLEAIKEDIFSDLILSHSEFQIRNFILGGDNGITPWGKYKQCLRELYKRIQSLKEINYQIDKKEIEIERLKKEEVKDDLDLKEKYLDLDYQYQHLKILKDSKEDIIREGNIFLEVYLPLKEQIDELLANNTKEDLEKDYWINKLKSEIEYSKSNIPKGLIQTIQGMESNVLENFNIKRIKA